MKKQLEFINSLAELLEYATKYSVEAELQLSAYEKAMKNREFYNPITFWTNEEKLRHKCIIKSMVKNRIRIRLKKEIEKLNNLL
jgi:hypothetical protein